MLLTTFLLSSFLFSQNNPTYPEPQENFKRVDFILPKIDNPEDFKVEITFSMEAEIVECSSASFSFNINKIEEGYGIPSSRFPYYIVNAREVEIAQGYNGDCNNSKPKSKLKIYSSYKSMENYHYAFPIPYYIPKNWNLEYRVFKAVDKYKSIE